MQEAEGVITYPETAAGSGSILARDAGAAAPTAEAFLYGRPVQVRLSRAAQAAAARLTASLIVEMELYFSCLVRKAVRFRPADPANPAAPASDIETTPIAEHLLLCFRPVTTRHCALTEDAGAPPLESMPVKRPQAFLPRWIEIDFRRGQWLGEFGY